jgi:hypothetical protein
MTYVDATFARHPIAVRWANPAVKNVNPTGYKTKKEGDVMNKTFTLNEEEMRLIVDGLHNFCAEVAVGVKLGSYGIYADSLERKANSARELIARMNAPQETVVMDELWVADDGSWGLGEIAVFDSSKWNKRQQAWLEKLSDSDAMGIEAVYEISKKQKPEELK